MFQTGLIFPGVGSYWIFWRSKKKKVVKLRNKLFVENGGLILQKKLSGIERLTIFTAEDLKKATDMYDERRIISCDKHNEPVFKGTLCTDGKNVPVSIYRFAEAIDPNRVEDFISKLIIFSHIHHNNLLNLIGCCLETQVPLLVYEFITSKTLQDSIPDEEPFLSWKICLRIACETARAIAYLHSDSCIPVIHGDIKSANILLDSNATIKVGPPLFDGSRVGTIGYLDPEWFFLGELTEKSDVYSFGVVLAELLTGSTVWKKDRSEGQQNLASYFVSAIREGRLHQILVDRLVKEVKIEQLEEVAVLTERCLRLQSQERPTMTQVTMELNDVLMRLELDQNSAESNSHAICS